MREAISEQILNAAATLFYKDGIRAVGIDRIIEEADVAKATLYRHFPSKDHLVAAYLQARHERVLQSLHEVLATVQEPRARISTIFERLREKADNADFRGCAFALAMAEHGNTAQVISIAQAHKAAVRGIFSTILTGTRDVPRQVSAHLALLYEGALATVAVGRDPDVILVARDCALMVFDTATSTLHPS